jgi:hypothetical protein
MFRSIKLISIYTYIRLTLNPKEEKEMSFLKKVDKWLQKNVPSAWSKKAFYMEQEKRKARRKRR